jgi:ABC-type sugar transport system substrate-binding protein
MQCIQEAVMDRRKFLKSASAAGGIAFFGSLIAACSSNGGSELSTSSGSAPTPSKGRIGFSFAQPTIALAVGVKRFASERAKQLGYEMLYDNCQGKPDIQIQNLQSWILQKVDAISVLPVDPTSLASTQAQAQAAGVKWTTYDYAAEGGDGEVLLSNDESGKLIADDVVKWINAQASPPKVLLLTASVEPLVAARISFPKQAIETLTKATTVAAQDAFDQETGLTVTESILAAHPDLSVVVGVNDDGALGALKAFQNAGKKPADTYIAGQDGSLDALNAIKAGTSYKGTAALRIRDLGYAVVDVVEALRTGKPHSTDSVSPVLVSVADTRYLKSLIDDWA